VQASPVWTPPTGTLGQIVSEALTRVASLRAREASLERTAADAPAPPGFATALRGPHVGIVAEVKRRSPSKGWINPDITAASQAGAYERGGAAAISVLTEPEHFGGSPEDLVSVRAAVRIPVVKKDFHVHPVQLLEARALGASAALLIARALSPATLREMVDAARQLRLEVLIEVRDEDELVRALDLGAAVIGINNRNLETLSIDPSTSERMLQLIPPSVVAIAESGVSGRYDVERVAACGADAVLVGSAVSAAGDPVEAVRTLANVPRITRAS
jgi:indole-3-glycerol phosphate synthase